MSIPDYQSLMLPVLMASSKGEVHIGAVVDELANQLALSQEERSQLLPSGQQTVFSNRVHWAKSYLSKAENDGIGTSPGASRNHWFAFRADCRLNRPISAHSYRV
jgi:restriction endonuclease Mrr